MVELGGETLASLRIPPGVAHGFLFSEPSLMAYAVSAYWDPADEIACRWDDPALGIDWPSDRPLLSPRDAAAPPLAEILALVPPYAELARSGAD